MRLNGSRQLASQEEEQSINYFLLNTKSTIFSDEGWRCFAWDFLPKQTFFYEKMSSFIASSRHHFSKFLFKKFLAGEDIYENGIFIENEKFPLEVSVPPGNATTDYKLIGNDSLYFATGSIFMDASVYPSTPGGVIFIITGDKLMMSGSRDYRYYCLLKW